MNRYLLGLEVRDLDEEVLKDLRGDQRGEGDVDGDPGLAVDEPGERLDLDTAQALDRAEVDREVKRDFLRILNPKLIVIPTIELHLLLLIELPLAEVILHLRTAPREIDVVVRTACDLADRGCSDVGVPVGVVDELDGLNLVWFEVTV